MSRYKIKESKDIKCSNCKIVFSSNRDLQKYCSKNCSLDSTRKRTGRYALNIKGSKKIATSTVGAISEMIVISDLLTKGYDVFRAVSASCYCDAVAIKKDICLQVEIRTGYRNEINGKLSFPPKIQEGANMFAIYVRVENKIYYLNKDKKEITLA